MGILFLKYIGTIVVNLLTYMLKGMRFCYQVHLGVTLYWSLFVIYL